MRLTVDPIPVVRVGFIGLGMRGPGAVERFANIDGVEIVALCDLYPERVDKSQEILAGHNLPAAAPYSGEEGWKELCRRDDIDLVYICTPWYLHVPMAVYAMEHGKHVAVEVPAAMSLDECWQLVDTAEKTQRHCMMLENCVYDFFGDDAQHGSARAVRRDTPPKAPIFITSNPTGIITRATGASTSTGRTAATSMPRTASARPAGPALDIHRGDKMNYLGDGYQVGQRPETRQGEDGCETFANADQTLTSSRPSGDARFCSNTTSIRPVLTAACTSLRAPRLRQ